VALRVIDLEVLDSGERVWRLVSWVVRRRYWDLEAEAERREVMIVEMSFRAEIKSPAEKPKDILVWSWREVEADKVRSSKIGWESDWKKLRLRSGKEDD
jgi:hypothetical protein